MPNPHDFFDDAARDALDFDYEVRVLKDGRKIKVAKPKLGALQRAVNDRATIIGTDPRIDNVPVRSTVNPKLTGIKQRLLNTVLTASSIAHVTNRINTPGNQFFVRSNRWLDMYEGQLTEPDIKIVVGQGFTAYYDRIWVEARDGFSDLADVSYVTTGGRLIYKSDQNECACEPHCDDVIVVKSQHVALLDTSHYVCVKVDTESEAIREMLIGTAHWDEYINAYNALATIDPPLQCQLLSMVNNVRYGQPQQAWIDYLSGVVTTRTRTLVQERIRSSEYFAQVLAGRPPADWPLNGTVRDLLRMVLVKYDEYKPIKQGLSAADLLDIPLEYNPAHNDWSMYHNGGSVVKGGGGFDALAKSTVDLIMRPITEGVELKFTGVNLIARNLAVIIEDPAIDAFDEPVSNLLTRMSNGPDLVAAALLKATAMVYGFKRWSNKSKSGWTKRKTAGDGAERSATIWDNGQIIINDAPKCIVFSHGREAMGAQTTVGLPYGDEIANRMWMLATSARETVGTISQHEMADLRFLFAEREIKDKSIDDLAAEILKGMRAANS